MSDSHGCCWQTYEQKKLDPCTQEYVPLFTTLCHNVLQLFLNTTVLLRKTPLNGEVYQAWTTILFFIQSCVISLHTEVVLNE